MNHRFFFLHSFLENQCVFFMKQELRFRRSLKFAKRSNRQTTRKSKIRGKGLFWILVCFKNLISVNLNFLEIKYMKKEICDVVDSIFIVHYNDFFRGSGIEVVLLVRAADEEDALTKLAISYLGWEPGTFELVEAKARQKHFFEGEVQTEVWKLKTLLEKFEKKQIEVLFETRVPNGV
jgi:hypothetical protein